MLDKWLTHDINLSEFISVVAIIFGGSAIFVVFRFFISRHIVKKLVGCESCHSDDLNERTRIYHKIAIIAGLVTSLGLTVYLPHVPVSIVKVIIPIISSMLIALISWFILNMLDSIHASYSKKSNKSNLSIKGYIQLAKILVFSASFVLVIATLADKSPLIILSSLGAAAAIILFLFQHTLISLVANLQVSSSNSIQLGDWVEIPHLNINGIVIDLALHTTTVRNWDNTVSRLPTKSFITEHFTNWQPMFSSGGRRIKRSIYIDQQSVTFVDDTISESLNKLYDLTNIQVYDPETDNKTISNLTIFREFIEKYLQSRDDIRNDMLLMVRQGAPSAEGLPLEIYCFTSKVGWAEHEKIQSEIFELLIPIAKYFSLRIYQKPSGESVSAILKSTC
ncbi:mechanosensitive ion channel family protein [Klebsiella aerogenes]|uniref:Mechanosensitive ion channel n=1 Tax=Klebsiella aerogenes TaxID=548 RepID=A0AAP9R294_KLEAE|nr:mechanosensitive ion channel domain-containing protein [Klebsiella aerogenes]QMR43095.1 mechanosensitive ion channel [Klebsiella aerogenes]